MTEFVGRDIIDSVHVLEGVIRHVVGWSSCKWGDWIYRTAGNEILVGIKFGG